MLTLHDFRSVQSYILILIFITPGIFAKSPEKKTSYLSQTYVDTMVQRAIYIINDAATVAGVGFRRKESLEEAKQIARALKARAKGDPNERYVKWKVGELELQIYLEEKDLVLQQMQKGISSSNQLILQFNKEVGKQRPDFALLHSIHVRMTELNPSKANEIASSFNKRHRQISREAVFAIEKSLMIGDENKVKNELDYCMANNRYLGIGESKIDQLNRRYEGLITARETIPKIDAEAEQARQILPLCRPGEVRKHLDYANGMLADIKNDLPQQEYGAMAQRLRGLSNTLAAQEDSLVRVNLAILNTKGVQAANDYLQKVMRAKGVSVERTSYVDQTILGIATPDDLKTASEISAVAESNEQEAGVFDAMRSTAKKKAQVRIDSILSEERKKTAYLEQLRQDSIRNAMQAALTRASQVSIDIFTMLEQNRVNDALKRFTSEREYLRRNLPADSYSMLEATLLQSKEVMKAEPVTAVAAAGAPPGPSDVSYVKLSDKAEPAPPSTGEEERLQKNRKRAQDMIMEIYGKLEHNMVQDAWGQFSRYKVPLQKYLDKEAFDMLAATVTQAHDYSIQSNSENR